MTFYERCEAIAEKKKLSFNEIGRKVGVSGAAITGWKNGSFPKADVIVKVAKLLETSVEYLVTGQDNDYSILPEELEIIQLYRKIQPTLKSAAKEQLSSLASIQTPITPPSK